uniref:hypothetical protein n=1 Tax=Brachyspira catarrhinii TaxID=2528966 RepID=UPI003F4C8AEF
MKKSIYTEIYTEEEIIEKIKKIDEEIEKQMSMSEYDVGDGQGNQRVKYRSLDELRNYKKDLEKQLEKLNPEYARNKFYAIRGNIGNRRGTIE